MAKKIKFDNLTVDPDKLFTKVIMDIADSAMSRGTLADTWLSNLKQYRGILPKKVKPWPNCSNLHLPMTETTVDTYQANLMKSFFSTSEFVDVRPVSSADTLTAEKRKQFLNWQLVQEIGIHTVVDKILEICLLYGDCIAKSRYVRDVRKKKEARVIITEDENGIPQETEEMTEIEEVVQDSPLVDIPNIDDIFLAPNAIGVQRKDSEYVIHRTRLTKSEYIQRVQDDDYESIDFDTIKDVSTVLESTPLRDTLMELQGLSREIADPKNMVTLLEWHGTFFNEEEDDFQEIVAIVHPSSKKVVKAFVNPMEFRPFVKFTPFPVANQAYGRGLPEKLKFLQAEVNTIHNQRVDSATKRIMQPGFYNEGSSFDPRQYELEPNGMYPVDNVANLFFPSFQDAPASQYREEELLWRYAEQLTAASENVQGILSRGEKTATEIVSANTRGSIRFDLIYQRLERAFIELVWQITRLDQENMPAEKEFRIVGSDGRFKWTTIKDAEMAGKLDLALMGTSVVEDRSKIARAQLLYQANVTNPVVASNQRALYENLKFLNQTVGGKDVNIDRLIPPPPQAATRTPQEEHDLMYEGRIVVPDVREDAQLHLVTHDAETQNPEFQSTIPLEIQAIFMQHIEKTKSLIAAQMQMQQLGAFQQIGTGQVQPGKETPAPLPGQGGMQVPKQQQREAQVRNARQQTQT